MLFYSYGQQLERNSCPGSTGGEMRGILWQAMLGSTLAMGCIFNRALNFMWAVLQGAYYLGRHPAAGRWAGVQWVTSGRRVFRPGISSFFLS